MPKFPPLENCTHTRENEKGVQFLFLHECFGIIIPFNKPKIDNASWQNWKTQNRKNIEIESNKKWPSNLL